MSRIPDNTDDVIDVRDVFDRVESLRDDLEPDTTSGTDHVAVMSAEELDEARAELATLEALLSDLRGNGGDEQYEGEWYPVTLIRDSYFRDYAMEFAEEIGAISETYTWPTSCIDWDQAARELRMDYTSVEFDGITYWVR